jgi:hypothetical protein
MLHSDGSLNITTSVNLGDNEKAYFGDANDLVIFHNASKSIIEDVGTGNLEVRGTNIEFLDGTGSEYYLTMANNGSVGLYWDGNLKLSTTSTGVDVSGTVQGDALVIDGNSVFNGNATIDQGALSGNTLSLDRTGADGTVGFFNSGTQTGLISGVSGGGINAYVGAVPSLAMTIKASGNVGIGVSSPNEKLTVSGNIELYNDDVDGYIWFHDGGTRSWTIGSQQSTGNFVLTNAVNVGSGEKFVVTGGGNVGIGHLSPQFGLTIAQGNGDAARIGWEDGSDNKRASIICSSSTDALQFHTGTSDIERMRIAADGSITIPNQNAINEITFTGSDFTNIFSQSTGGLQLGTIQTGYLELITNNASRMYIQGSSGNVTFNGGQSYSSQAKVNIDTDGDKAGLRIKRSFYNWFQWGANPSNGYLHIKTGLSSGANGNTHPTMSLFHIKGYTYSAETIDTMIGFHNWSGSIYSLNITNNGSRAAGVSPYASSDGYVVLVLSVGTNYPGITIDWHQAFSYGLVDVGVLNYAFSANTSGVY